MVEKRVYNFNPGPAALPLEVLEEAQKELLNYKGTGMSIMETSHRSKEVEGIVLESGQLVKEMLGLGENYRVLFLQGGASLQFAMVPLNFLRKDQMADYIVTGSFAEKAMKEAKKIGQVHIAFFNKEENHTYIPKDEELSFSEKPAYIHLTSNNTIYGTQWKKFPSVPADVPLVADMSSDILSRFFDASPFGLIYAGAQKNLGPAGVTLVIIRDDMLEKVPEELPSMLRYDLMAKENSLYNTAPVFAIYMVNLVLRWTKKEGGLKVIEERNEKKAKLIYDAIDKSNGFYRGHARPDSRSTMNVTFRLPSEDLEKEFLTEAAKNDLVGLKGHRSVGGLRASLYNAVSYEAVKALADFMDEFYRRHA